MTDAAANNAGTTTKNGASGAYSRFEPIKKILVRCDEKTKERAPILSRLAA